MTMLRLKRHITDFLLPYGRQHTTALTRHQRVGHVAADHFVKGRSKNHRIPYHYLYIVYRR